MSALQPIQAVGLADGAPQLNLLGAIPLPGATAQGGANFGQILSSGIEAMDRKLANADDLVRQFALDDSVPVHQVTIALEEARIAVELAMQVRARLVETYRELMTMQL